MLETIVCWELPGLRSAHIFRLNPSKGEKLADLETTIDIAYMSIISP